MRGNRGQRGAALVEFALVSALLFLLLFGIIEMGLIFQDQAQVGQAAREAARSAAVGEHDGGRPGRGRSVPEWGWRCLLAMLRWT